MQSNRRFNDFIKDDCISEGDGQVAFGSASLPEKKKPCSLETEEQRTLKGLFIAHKFSTGWTVGVVQSVEKKKLVAGHKSETYSWTRKRNKKDYGVDKYLSTGTCCFWKRVNTVKKQ